MTNLVQERDLTKLPKWAQEYFADLRRQRDFAVQSLNDFVNTQTPSKFWVDEHVCTGEEQGPVNKRHYIQAHQITVQMGKDEVYILLRQNGELDISSGFGKLRIQPVASNCIRIEEPKR